jgi:hypothetical protein
MELEPNQDTAKAGCQSEQDLPRAGQRENSDEALVDTALACVRWDESVNLDRLMALEFQHNFATLQALLAEVPRVPRTVWKLSYLVKMPLGASSAERIPFMHSHEHSDPSLFVNGRVKLEQFCGAWRINDEERITDVQLAGLLAVAARLDCFWFWANASKRIDYKDTWLSRVIEGLARRARAWTGDEIMRTRNLCTVLIALIDARHDRGPLARVDVPKSGLLDQGIVPTFSHDTGSEDDPTTSMRAALARVHSLVGQGIIFYSPCDRRHTNLVDAAKYTRRLLASVQHGVERLYATEPYFLGLIAPAEYEAMVNGAPLAATFFH